MTDTDLLIGCSKNTFKTNSKQSFYSVQTLRLKVTQFNRCIYLSVNKMLFFNFNE